MSERLPQHIYTSTGRMNFETVAISPGVSGEVLKQLEARAQSYPTKALWGDGAATPPYVVRGFRLAGDDGANDFAVSLSFYVGRSLSSPEGNYLSHSYVIPRGLLARHGYNLPWLAACLPCHFRYYPVRGSGADVLDPLAFDLDPARQFKLFSFVARELTEGGLRALVRRLARHAEAAPGEQKTLDLGLPPPHAELGRIHQEVMGMPPETAPAPDALRLLRLAGALAILPDAFKQNLTFTVNDSAPAAGWDNQDTYAVRVARAQGVEPPPAPGTWKWFDYCITLAAENRLDELSELRAWLSRLLPVGRSPSLSALDITFAFYQFWERGRRPPGESPSAALRAPGMRALIERVNEFKKCDVDLDALYDLLLPLLEPQEASYEDQCNLCVVLSEVAASNGRLDEPPPRRVFAAVKECLRAVPQTDNGARLRFWRRLPEVMKLHLWESSYAEEQPPGYVPLDGQGRPDPYHLNFALTTFKPSLLHRSLAARRGIVEHLAKCLLYPRAAAGSFYRGLRREALAKSLSGLDVLFGLAECDAELLRQLSERLAGQFCSALQRNERGEELTHVVAGALERAAGVNTTLLAEFVCQVAIQDRDAVLELLRGLSLEPRHRGRSRDFLRALGGVYITDAHLRALIRVLLEMCEVLDRPALCDTDQHPMNVLPRLNEMSVQLEKLPSGGEWLMHAQRALLPALRELRPVDRFCVGVAYLWVFAPFDDGLFSELMAVLRADGAEIARWCVSELRGMPQGRGRSLARFLRVVDRCYRDYLNTAFERTLDALSSLRDTGDRRALLIQLNHYLKDTKASGSLKSAVQEHLDRLGSERRR